MWVLMNDSAVSIVEDKIDDDILVVRGRVKGDVENFLGPYAKYYEVTKSLDSDYMFRAYVFRQDVADIMYNKTMGIDYPNFKNSVKDHSRHVVYNKIWSIMFNYQLSKHPNKNNPYIGYDHFLNGKIDYSKYKR